MLFRSIGKLAAVNKLAANLAPEAAAAKSAASHLLSAGQGQPAWASGISHF